MRFSKSSVKTHIVRGATSKQAKSRSVQKAGPSCEKNSFYWCKTTQTISNDFSAILVQKDFKHGLKLRSQPLQSKEIKISSTVLIHKIYQRAIKPPKDFIKFSSQVPLFNGHAALQGPSPDSKHKDLIFTFFCNRGNSMSFGSKLANSPQTGVQAKESKIKLKNHR